MRKKSSITFGPGASSLILIFVVLALSILGMLSLMNGRNDVRLSERSAQVIEAVYALNVRAEEKRAEIDAAMAAARRETQDEEAYLQYLQGALPEDVSLEGDEISWMESDGFRTLDCALQVLPWGAENRAQWVRYDLSAETEEVW